MTRQQIHILLFFNDTATTEIYTLSLHDALPISSGPTDQPRSRRSRGCQSRRRFAFSLLNLPWGRSVRMCRRSEEHTYELQSRQYLVCRLLLEKKKHQYFVERLIVEQLDVITISI